MKKLSSTIIISILILATAAACINITIDKTYIKDGMHEDYQPPASAELYNTFNYSGDQVAVVAEYGSPTRFTILFGENNRLETWYYDTRGYTVVFMNGTKTSDAYTVSEYQDEMYATTHSPSMFYSGMGINEIVLSTGQHDFLLSTLESESINGRLMHMEGLSIGLEDGSINFVETYPALTERKLSAEEFTPSIKLTPEETVNQGSHEYLVVINLDGEVLDSYNTFIDMQFTIDGVCFEENSESYCFMRIENNRYATADGQTMMSIILDGFIWLDNHEGSQTEVLFSRLDD